MKKIYFLVLALCFLTIAKAQIINITDAKFKAKLLASSPNNTIAKNLAGIYFKIDVNNNKEIEQSEALQVKELYVDYSDISNLNEIHFFQYLTHLYCTQNSIQSLDLSSNLYLSALACSNNPLSSLDLTYNVQLTTLFCSVTNINSLNLNNNTSLLYVDLDLNYLLRYLFIKNGQNEKFGNFHLTPITYVCCDDSQYNDVISMFQGAIINNYCTFVPGGTFYKISGNNKFNLNKNGCDINDFILPNLKYNVSNNTVNRTIISNTTGYYSIPVQIGKHIITPILENPAYFNISPATVNVTFPTQASPFVQDFCITANGVHPDLEVTLLPLQAARPGFDAKYKIIYKNKGNQIQSGSVNLTFDDTILDLLIANPPTLMQTANNLSWNFSNLKPFDSREITFTLNVNSPTETPAVNNDDILKLTATIASQNTDETPIDNSFTINQTVVGSYDPNDKTCLEGSVITPNLIGEYVHYMIRFENTGTYPAQNIVAKDMIDLTKFDISTLIPTSSSHPFVTKISEGNKVEFIFENINLPFDDVNNDGYVAFKIKTLPTLKVGDTFTNEANIYFDYNFPILTNKAASKFQTTLSNPDFEFSNYFTLYPNPVNDVLNISATQNIEIQSFTIYDILGQLVIAVPNAKSVSNIDVSKLRTGNYFIKVKSDKGSSSMKFIKK